jgi:hypothetical protein
MRLLEQEQNNKKSHKRTYLFINISATLQGLPILTVGTSMAVTITHVFLWGSSATNHIENALMGSPCHIVSYYIIFQLLIWCCYTTC